MSRKLQFAFLAIFLLSAFLRLALVAFNREANDAHETVAAIILNSRAFPQKDDCWECFQPKLFHFVFAQAIRTLGLGDDQPYRQNVAGQAVNFLAGIATLLVVWRFVAGLPIKEERLKPLAFGLVALNPALIGISSQATNDAFAILFSTLALYSAYSYFQQPRIGAYVLILVFVSLGISSKVNCWVTAISIGTALLVRAWVEEGNRGKTRVAAIAFLISTAAIGIFNPLNQYVANYSRYGSPVLLNIHKEPYPPFTGSIPAWGTGIWNIRDGFLTFKFVNLLNHPRIETDPANVQRTQTSFWTTLYGRAHSVVYDNSLPSWSTSGTTLFPLGRGIFLLAIIPTFLLLVGAALEMLRALKGVFRRDCALCQSTHFGLFALTLTGYVLFEILYAFQYRSFTVLKPIFIYPALLSFPLLFIRSTELLYARVLRGKRWPIAFFEAGICALLLFYVVDVGVLIVQLGRNYVEGHRL